MKFSEKDLSPEPTPPMPELRKREKDGPNAQAEGAEQKIRTVLLKLDMAVVKMFKEFCGSDNTNVVTPDTLRAALERVTHCVVTPVVVFIMDTGSCNLRNALSFYLDS